MPSRRPHLFQFFPSPERGGCEEQALTIAREAVRRGFRVTACFPQLPATKSLITDYLDAGVAFTASRSPWFPDNSDSTLLARMRRIRIDAGHFLAMLWLIARHRPDVAMVSLPWPTLCHAELAAFGVLRIPTVAVFQLMEAGWAQISPARRGLLSWVRRRGQRWLGVSEHTSGLIRELFRPHAGELIQTIYNGVEISPPLSARAQSVAAMGLRSRYGIPTDSPLLLSVGRLDEQKGCVELVDAAESLLRDFPSLRFLWVGEGKLRSWLEKQLAGRGLEDSFLLAGYQSDVASFLAAADLFVFPSHYEGMPFALLEAIAEGVPVVAANISPVREIIEDGKSGTLFAPRSSAALVAAIEKALDYPVETNQMAAVARLNVPRFDVAAMYDAYFALFETALAGELASRTSRCGLLRSPRVRFK